MSTAIRYKFIKNTTGAVIANMPITNDGDDRKSIIVRRVLAAGDTGTAVGQIGHADGMSVDTMPSGSNVLFVKGSAYRPAVLNGVIYFELLDNNYFSNTVYSLISYGIGKDNSLRAKDTGLAGGLLVEGDVLILEVFMGSPVDANDKITP